MTLGQRVRVAREAAKLTQAQLAKRIGMSQPAIRKIESGETKKSKYMPEIANILGVPLNVLDPTLKLRDTAPSTFSPVHVEPLSGNRTLPVYAAGEGGRGTMVLSSDAVDYARRPESLENVKDGYGLIVIGDSMRPEFKPGDTALVHPHLPPTAGEGCVLQSDDGHGTVTVMIKSFVRSSATHWFLEQHNPKKAFSLAKTEWQKCHLIVGKYGPRR